MQAFPTLVELFGRLTGIRDPSVPLPIDSLLSGGKVPPPVLGGSSLVPSPATQLIAVPESESESPPPRHATAREQGIKKFANRPQRTPQFYVPVATADGITILLPYNDGGMTVGLTHEGGRLLFESLLHYYGVPADFHG